MAFDSSIFRGEYRFPEKDRRLILFKGLAWERQITPTDIDFFVEFSNRCYVLGEFKEHGVDMPNGQQLALERLCQRVGHCGLLFIAEHQASANDIVAADCRVRSTYRYRDGTWFWVEPNPEMNVRELIEHWRFLTGITNTGRGLT